MALIKPPPFELTKATKKVSREKSKHSLADQFDLWLGKRKTSEISYSHLRSLSMTNNLVRVVINRLKHSITKIPWIVKAKEEKEQDGLLPQIDYVENLLKRPNENDDTFRTLISKAVEDVLVVDRGSIEKVRNNSDYVVELYQFDGATLEPSVDDFGLYKKPAYKQFMRPGDKEPAATFELNDLLIFQMNPCSEADRVGEGISPVESIIATVLSSIQALAYNTTYFSNNKLPPFIANLVGVPVKDLKAFKAGFEKQLDRNTWAGAYTNAEDFQFQHLRPTNQEMQFYELNLWLARIIFAAFEVSPQDLGFTMDINKATANVQREISKSQGVANLLSVIAEEINVDLIQDLAQVDGKFNRIEFVWDDQDKIDEKTQAEIDEIHTRTQIREINEIRVDHGWDPIEEPEEEETMEDEVEAEQKDNEQQDEQQKLFKDVQKTHEEMTALLKSPQKWDEIFYK